MNYYKILGIKQTAKREEIKKAYRNLAKKYHPDKGGSKNDFLNINTAWQILSNPKTREEFDSYLNNLRNPSINLQDYKFSEKTYQYKNNSSEKDSSLKCWIKDVFLPINKIIGQVINQLSKEIKNLEGDPYDELLMNPFCNYLEQSQKKLEKVYVIYNSKPIPSTANNFALNLYHCFSEVQDSLNELEKYTMGYVDNYLRDGKEMMNSAKKKRSLLSDEKNTLPIN